MNISNIEKDFLQISVDVGNGMGLDSLSSSIFSILQLADKPISMEELSEKTGYSLTSIFNKLKMLEHIHHRIKKIKEPGSKKSLFYIEKNFPSIIKQSIMDAYEKKITPLKSRLPRIIEKYEKLKLNKEDSKKIIILKNYYKQVNDMERKTKKIIEIFEND